MWKPTTVEHLRALKDLGPQRMSFESIDDILANDELCALLEDWCRTCWEQDRPIGLLGAWPAWHGVAVVWALLTDELIARPVTLSRGARHWIEYVVAREGIHRVQTTIQPGHDAALRWARWLGFEREGLMERASPQGSDLWLYARVF
jgi:hypothetical protein